MFLEQLIVRSVYKRHSVFSADITGSNFVVILYRRVSVPESIPVIFADGPKQFLYRATFLL